MTILSVVTLNPVIGGVVVVLIIGDYNDMSHRLIIIVLILTVQLIKSSLDEDIIKHVSTSLTISGTKVLL